MPPAQKATLDTIMSAIQNMQSQLDELADFKSEMLDFKEASLSVYDHFIKSQETFNLELLALRNASNRHETRIINLEQKTA